MSNPHTIHIVPHAGGQWEVRTERGGEPLHFSDLGSALDAATAATVAGETTRVIIHQTYSTA